ncbi:MAG: M48 family metallopeptidase [Deltaproteobacteria bacterium]|nr:M48 family metallopeptidase [Deltaproteobacteria bacterium]
MNIYALIIIVALLGSYLLEVFSEALNLKNLKPELPGEFKGYYDEEKYGKSQEYTRATTSFGLVSGTFDLVLLLAFWRLGGFNSLDMYLRAYGFGEIATGLFYIASLLLAKTVISLPFSIYSTFVIEERFGFNKTTAATFVADLFKGIILSMIIGGLVMATVLWFFETAGALAWFYCWIAVTFFILLLQFIAPTWIMPLFNKFSPLEEGELRNSILAYAKSVNFSVENLFVIDGSKRSSKSNAFFTGFGKNKRIALFDTLIEGHSVSELVAVLAHEIGHFKKKHVIKGMVISIIHMGIMLYLLSIFVSHRGLFDAFYMENVSVYSGLLFFGLLFSPIEMVLSIFMNIFSRKNEYEADRFAAETTGRGDDMISALKKLSVHNLSNLTPHPFYVFLNYSHPPLIERIKAMRG